VGLEEHGSGRLRHQTGIADADIDAPEAWTRSEGAGATVAVVDTGIELTQEDLTGQFAGNPGERGGWARDERDRRRRNGYVDDWQGWDFVNGDNTDRDAVERARARTSPGRSPPPATRGGP